MKYPRYVIRERQPAPPDRREFDIQERRRGLRPRLRTVRIWPDASWCVGCRTFDCPHVAAVREHLTRQPELGT